MLILKPVAVFVHFNFKPLSCIRPCSQLGRSNLSTCVVPKPVPESSRKGNARSSGLVVYYNTQITKHGREGNIEAAESLFRRMPIKTTVSWTAMLTAYADNGQIQKARKLFDEMPDRTTASYNAMISAYIRNDCNLSRAFQLFVQIPDPNAVSYATMITGSVRAGLVDTAKRLYSEVPVKWRDPTCSNALINGCLKAGAFEEAVAVFEGMKQRNVVSFSSMIDGYCKLGSVADARELFDKMPDRNVISWTAMINGYLKMGDIGNGFQLFSNMRKDGVVGVNSTTLTVMIEACVDLEQYREGTQVHCLVVLLGFEFDVFLGNSLINMYGRFGYTDAASRIFHSMMTKRRDLVSWNSLIAAYVQKNDIEQAFIVFNKMPVKDAISWTTMISGLSGNGMMHKSIELFETMPVKDHIAWTSIITGFVSNEEYEEALNWFIKMLKQGVSPNPLTMSSVLSASAGLAMLNQGLQIHARVVKTHLETDVSVQNSLVSMYSKCGSMVDACRIFSRIITPNVVSYNSIITGLSQNGFGKEALGLFKKMQEEAQKPNHITFLALLSGCCHAGLVEEGWSHFNSMKHNHGLEPGPDHYACMVDLLCRAGLLDEAVGLVRSMSFKRHPGVWGALLSASSNYQRVDIGEIAAQNLIKLQPDSATTYVVLSNLYQGTNDKRVARKCRGVRKSPGCSWIYARDSVVLFLAGDKSHSDIEDITYMLLSISKEMLTDYTDVACLLVSS